MQLGGHVHVCKRQHLAIAELKSVPTRSGDQRVELSRRHAGLALQVDFVVADSTAEVSDGYVAAVEHERVRAAATGQHVAEGSATSETAIQNIVVAIAREVVREARAEQVANVGERIDARTAGVLGRGNREITVTPDVACS